MKRIIAIVLALLMCFALAACGKNKKAEENSLSPEEITDIKSQVVGDWYDVSIGNDKISFNENGTGSKSVDGVKSDFTWSYDTSEESLYIRVSGKNFYFDIANNGTITYLDMWGSWFFREADMESGKAMVLSERRSGIAKDIEGKEAIKSGIEVKLNDTFGVKVDSVSYTDGRLTVEMTLKNNTASAASLDGISKLIYVNKTKFYMADAFATVALDTLGLSPEITQAQLAAGEALSLSLNIFTLESFENIVEHYGEVNAYRSIMLGENEYYIDIGSYVK